jgi:hypothetical protein
MRYNGCFRRPAIGFLCVLAGLSGSLNGRAAESPWHVGAEAFYTHDDNIGKSQWEADREKDASFTVTGNAGYTLDLSFFSALTLTATASNEEFMDFDGLSNTEAGLGADYRFQTRTGFSAPAYSVFVRVTGADYETDIRDGTTAELGGSVKRRFTGKLTGTLGMTASQRRADGAVFDLDRIRYFGNIDWRLSGRVAAYSTLSYIDGDVVSTATANGSNLPAIGWADAIEPDNAFGGLANNKFAYRLDAETVILRLGMNIALNRNASIDISVDELDSDAAGPVEYELTAISVGGLYRF